MKRLWRDRCLAHGETGSMTVSFLLGMTFLVIPSLMLMLAAPVWEARSTDASDEAHAAVRALALSLTGHKTRPMPPRRWQTQ